MNKKLVGIVVSLAVVVIVCLASSGCLDWFEKTPMDHTYYYEVSVAVNETIYNVTLYLPVPMVNGEVHPIVKDRGYEIIDTEHGKMLKVERSKIAPNMGSLGAVLAGFEIKWKVDADYGINAKNPNETEPLLYPRFNESDHPYSVDELYINYNYSSYIYASYNTTLAATVYIDVHFRGMNAKGDWSERYYDWAYVELVGESDSYCIADGRLGIWR